MENCQQYCAVPFLPGSASSPPSSTVPRCCSGAVIFSRSSPFPKQRSFSFHEFLQCSSHQFWQLWEVSAVQFRLAGSEIFARSILQMLWSITWQISIGLAPCTCIANSLSRKNTLSLNYLRYMWALCLLFWLTARVSAFWTALCSFEFFHLLFYLKLEQFVPFSFVCQL